MTTASQRVVCWWYRSSVRQWRTSAVTHGKARGTAADYLMEIGSDERLVNSIKPRPSTNVRMNGKVLEEVDQFKYLGSTQTNDRASLKEVTIRLAQAHSAMTRLAILWKNKSISFPTKIKLYKSLILSIRLCRGVWAEHWLRIWRDESKLLKTNATGGWLAYHIEIMKRMNTYGSRSIFSPNARNFYCQLSSIASYHGSFGHYLPPWYAGRSTRLSL